MKILTVCSGLDYINYTRRATIDSIHKLNPDLDILLFNSILNIRKKKLITPNIHFYYYHFWVLERLRQVGLFSKIEYVLRSIRWRKFFCKYDLIFFIDPNQYYLLPYLNNNQKLVYLLRDPSVLQNPEIKAKEYSIIKRSDLILGISRNLCGYYFEKYYGYIPDHVKLWPNTVDLNLWDYRKWIGNKQNKLRPLIGLAGNINYVIDLDLLIYIVGYFPGYDFEIAGKLDLDHNERKLWDKLLAFPNLKYLGFIPYNKFPEYVINWDIGLVSARQDHEYARYLNNNKQYQYVALGKPFVTYKFNAEYSEFDDFAFIANNKQDFVYKIDLALEMVRTKDLLAKGERLAYMQSSDIRAKQFMEMVQGIL